jgi:hypothetical protein
VKYTLLLVLNNDDVYDTVQTILKDWEQKHPDKTINTERRLSLKDAQSKLQWAVDFQKPLDLVITWDELPENNDTSPQDGDCLGVQLIEQAHEMGSCRNSIVLAERYEPAKHQKCADITGSIMLEATNLYDDLLGAFNDLLVEGTNTTSEKEEPPPYKEPIVKIYLHKDKPSLYEVLFFHNGRKLRIGPKIFSSAPDWDKLEEKMATLNERIEKDENWKSDFQDIGELLSSWLRSHPDFLTDYGVAVGNVGGDRSRVRIRFTVTKQIFPHSFEALYDRETEGEKWVMLDARIYRTIATGQAETFDDKEALGNHKLINCLIINANAAGEAKKDGESLAVFRALEYTSRECSAIYRHMTGKDALQRQSDFRIGKIIQIPDPKDPKHGLAGASTFKERLENVLKENCIHLVHFAGHSLKVDEKTNAHGYLIVPSPVNGKVDYIEAQVFGDWLRAAGTQVVYLSSCDSAAALVVHVLAMKEVPAIIGYQWPVKDKAAMNFADHFYKYLFATRPSLEEAFRDARVQMHTADERQCIWAAPILVEQRDSVSENWFAEICGEP